MITVKYNSKAASVENDTEAVVFLFLKIKFVKRNKH